MVAATGWIAGIYDLSGNARTTKPPARINTITRVDRDEIRRAFDM